MVKLKDGDQGPNFDWDRHEVSIERQGKKIILPAEPAPMPIPKAIDALKILQKEEETIMDVHEVIDCFPLEGAVAFVEAMREIYGWATPVPKMSWFGPVPPDMLSVQVDVDKYVQVPWGEFTIPGIENNIGLSTKRQAKKEVLVVYGQVRKAERHILLDLAQKTRDILKKRSIYRGKALSIATDSDGKLVMSQPPKFVDLRQVDPDELVMNHDVEEQINTNILAPIVKTDAVRAAKIPLKRGVLLCGRFGVGKTMLTQIVAKKCLDHKWTFIMIDRTDSLAEALLFAQRYQPAIVFCEDIDRGMSSRDDQANEILNTIDGVVGKNVEIMVVLTTNHVERIEQAMLRPGRLDSVIYIAPPDADSVQRLIQTYSRGLLKKGEALDEVGKELAGQIPAVIREVVERSKLAMIGHGNVELRQEDLLVSARGMKMHLELLAEKDTTPTVEQRFVTALGEIVARAVHGVDLDEEDRSEIQGLHSTLRDGIHMIIQKQEEAGMSGRASGSDMRKIKEKVDDIHDEVVG